MDSYLLSELDKLTAHKWLFMQQPEGGSGRAGNQGGFSKHVGNWSLFVDSHTLPQQVLHPASPQTVGVWLECLAALWGILHNSLAGQLRGERQSAKCSGCSRVWWGLALAWHACGIVSDGGLWRWGEEYIFQESLDKIRTCISFENWPCELIRRYLFLAKPFETGD